MRGRLSRIDLLVPDDAIAEDRSACCRPALRVERPSRRNERVEKMLRAFRVNLFALAGVALLVGMFLVYNTVLISILRRRKDVGVLEDARRLAATDLRRLPRRRAALRRRSARSLGIALGNALASAILALIGRTINALYVTSRPEAIALTPGDHRARRRGRRSLLSLLSALAAVDRSGAACGRTR